MRRSFVVLWAGSFFALTWGCAKKATMLYQPPPAGEQSSGRDSGGVGDAGKVVLASTASPQRFIAEHDKIELLTSAIQLQKSWESAVHFCGTIQCEVVTSSLTTGAGGAQPT